MATHFFVLFLKRLLREACVHDEELFSAFLNRLFNTLSWAMTEFSVSVREMQEKYKVDCHRGRNIFSQKVYLWLNDAILEVSDILKLFTVLSLTLLIDSNCCT